LVIVDKGGGHHYIPPSPAHRFDNLQVKDVPHGEYAQQQNPNQPNAVVVVVVPEKMAADPKFATMF
jgi:hypothetical protein